MFEYFPGHYSWNMGLMMALQLGGELTEIDRACRPLRPLAARPDARDDPGAQQAWAEAWSALARQLADYGHRDAGAGHPLSAARKFRRACIYMFTAERMTSHRLPQKAERYAFMVDCFERWVRLGGLPIEFVRIPYEGTTLPALWYRAPGGGAAPAMIHFDGFDVTKEWMALCGTAEEFARRGVSTLMVDHPGIGAALRLQGLAMNPDSERWAAAALDWLEARQAANGDVDASRVGVVAMSLGGYYAPRAAAFEPRLTCCIAWGARWDNEGSHGRILRDPQAARSVTGWIDHALWYYGARTTEEAAERIGRMTLDGVMDRIRCPLLVVHGSGDRQVPIEQAQRMIDEARNSPRAELRLFGPEEGGVEHVNGDLFSVAVDVMADWAADVLNAEGET